MPSDLIVTGGIGDLPAPSYSYITNTEEALKALEVIERYPIVELDTETTGLDSLTAKVVLMQMGVAGKAYVFDVREGNVDAKIFKGLLESPRILKLIQNALFDVEMIYSNFGIMVKRLYDTMLAEQLLYLGLKPRANLPHLVAKYLKLLLPKDVATSFVDYYQKYTDYQLRYAANDVVVLKEIYNQQLPMLQRDSLTRVAKLEFEFVEPLAGMELSGILLSVPKWQGILDQKIIERDKIRTTLYDMFNTTIDQTTLFEVSLLNLDSPTQVIKSLNNLGIPVTTTDVKELSKYKNHPAVKTLLEYRKFEKFVTTYGDALLNRIHPVTGRLHTSFTQMVDTGRLSSSAPNLQNIPKEQVYRSCFVAKPGYKLITVDLSQCELRILASYSKDPIFLNAYATGIDLHIRTAMDIFNKTFEEIKQDESYKKDGDSRYVGYRNKTKSLNFGLCITGDTKVITNNGIKAVCNINVGDSVAHDVGDGVIIDKKYMGEKEVFEITSKFGYRLLGTKDHVIKVINSDGDYVDKKIMDLDVDTDYVCIKYGSNIFCGDAFKFDSFAIKAKTNHKGFVLPSELDEKWAMFLGLYVAEGHLHKNKSNSYNSIQFGFSVRISEFINKIDVLFSELFGDRCGKYTGTDVISYSINSVLVSRWVGSLFNIDFRYKTDNINIPDCIKCSPKHIQVSFLRGLFEGDGTVFEQGGSHRIKYDSKSYELIRDIQIMLLNMGILTTSYKKFDKRYPKENYYSISVISEFNKLFFDTVGFMTTHKNAKCVDNNTYKKSSWTLPYQSNRLKTIYSFLKASHKCGEDRNDMHYVYNTVNLTSIKGIGNFYLNKFFKYDPFLNFIYENNIVSLPIKAIKFKGIKKVYDISVDNHPYFLANGFVVHNCYGLTAVGLSIRLGISEAEAQDFIDRYFYKYKKVKQWLDSSAKHALLNRYSTSMSGRRRYYTLPNPSDPTFKRIRGSVERKAMNMPIQATNSDVIKQAMIFVIDRLKGSESKLILSVHDELVVESPEYEAKEVALVVENAMKDGFAEFIPDVKMEADAVIGDCWLKG